MRKGMAMVAVLCAVIATALCAMARDPSPKKAGKLVVHEWGTFTNFAGADGVQLEFRPLVENELPEFVFDRSTLGGWASLLTKQRYAGAQRMETPVTYFYTDRPRQVTASVDFPRGLLTEFYPPVKQMLPAYAPSQAESPPPLGDSRLDWGKVQLYPPADFAKLTRPGKEGQRLPVTLPAVGRGNHYDAARATDAAVVGVPDPETVGYMHFEKFLFYRGIGNFTLPLKLTALGDGRFTVNNDGPEPVGPLFLVDISEDGLRFAAYSAVKGQKSRELVLPGKTSTVDALTEDLVAALTKAGLYEKESRAMVETWRTSWFDEYGTRLLYLVPRRFTDEIIPLHVDPQPDETVRVLVGRMETLTPERAERLTLAIGRCRGGDAQGDELLRGELKHLGRFAEPALEYAVRTRLGPDHNIDVPALLQPVTSAATP